MHRIVADPAELRHSLGHSDPVAASDLVRLAKRIAGVRARAATGDFERLRRLPMPVLPNGADGWFVIARVGQDAVAVQRPGAGIERWDRAEQIGSASCGDSVCKDVWIEGGAVTL